MAATTSAAITGATVLPAGEVAFTGFWSGTLSPFGRTSGQVDGLIGRLKSNGALDVVTFEGSSDDQALAIASSARSPDSVVVAGTYTNDISLHGKAIEHSGNPSYDSFLAHLTFDAGIDWAVSFGDDGTTSGQIIRAVASVGDDIYVGGECSDSLRVGTFTSPCATGRSPFLALFKTDGGFVRAIVASNATGSVNAITSDSTSVTAVGGFIGTNVDFTGAGDLISSPADYDVFVVRIARDGVTGRFDGGIRSIALGGQGDQIANAVATLGERVVLGLSNTAGHSSRGCTFPAGLNTLNYAVMDGVTCVGSWVFVTPSSAASIAVKGIAATPSQFLSAGFSTNASPMAGNANWGTSNQLEDGFLARLRYSDATTNGTNGTVQPGYYFAGSGTDIASALVLGRNRGGMFLTSTAAPMVVNGGSEPPISDGGTSGTAVYFIETGW